MAVITTSVSTDEKTWQIKFYEAVFGSDIEQVTVDRSTDGYTKGIIFEHKQNVSSYGKSKTLSQALIYLSRFNRDGIPVPARICLVSQDEGKCFIYNTENYLKYVEDIEQYANMKASEGIPGFEAGKCAEEISFNLNNAREMTKIIQFVSKAPENTKVHINVHNVYGWSGFYYDNAGTYKQKPEKKAFFCELRNPTKTLANYIYPWTGSETDFKYIMDMLNDPMTQKKLGAFYTPPQYAKLACGLVKQAIDRALSAGKKDYVIIDRCAGTGNLEMYLDDANEDILSHVIVSTYELKEWMVLKDRFGSRVRYIIPPIPSDKRKLPELNNEGFLTGANALTKDIIDNIIIRSYLDNPDCAIILFENPPYVETTGVEFQRNKASKDTTTWKNDFVVQEMKKEVKGSVSNDMANAFIWSCFKYFLRQDSDSYIVFSPIKYWKVQHLINKKFLDGYAFNRKHFHASMEACVTCCLWSNEDIEEEHQTSIKLKAINLDDNKNYMDEGFLEAKKISSFFSEYYYDKRVFPDDKKEGILIGLNGLEKEDGKRRNKPLYNKNIVGYLIANTSGFDNPDLNSGLLIGGRYDGNGFYLRTDNFMEKLPMFAAARYYSYCSDWKVRAFIMKSADKASIYKKAVKDGKLDIFLFKTMFWTCLTHHSHIRSLYGSDRKIYINQLCFDGDTLAKEKMEYFIRKGYKLSEEEKTLQKKMNRILSMIKECKDEYNPKFKYGLYQIDEEINIKIQVGTKADGKPKMDFKYGDLNNLIKEIKPLVKEYYINNLVETLFKYDFLK